MHARAIDEAAGALQGLRHEEWWRLGLGGTALALALVATRVAPSLAIPLFVGGLVVVAGGVHAVWLHWDLVDRLAGERDAYVISEVRAYAAREATMERRRAHAATIRGLLDARDDLVGVPAVLADDLEALARELEDEALVLDPACAVDCSRLLASCAALQHLAEIAPVRSRVARIRAGLAPSG